MTGEANLVSAVPEMSFLGTLIQQLRAQDTGAAWDARSEWELLHPLILSGEQRGRESGEPDPEVFWRIELFYAAVGITIEQRTGMRCSPMLNMHHQGFGRLVLIVGRLVVLNKHLREVHRFGFDNIGSLSAAGERLVEEGIAMIERFPEIARAA